MQLKLLPSSPLISGNSPAPLHIISISYSLYTTFIHFPKKNLRANTDYFSLQAGIGTVLGNVS